MDKGQVCIQDLDMNGIPTDDAMLKTDARIVNMHVNADLGGSAITALDRFPDYFDRLVKHISTRETQEAGDQNPDITAALITHAQFIVNNFLKPFLEASQSFVGQFKSIERLKSIGRGIGSSLNAKIGLDTIQQADPALIDYDTVAGMYWDIKELAKQGVDNEAAKAAYWDIKEAQYHVGEKTETALQSEWLELKRDPSKLERDIIARSRFIVLEANFCTDNRMPAKKLADLNQTDIGKHLESSYEAAILPQETELDLDRAAIDYFKYDGLQTLHAFYKDTERPERTSIAEQLETHTKTELANCLATMEAAGVHSLNPQNKTRVAVTQMFNSISYIDHNAFRGKLINHLISKVATTQLVALISSLKKQINTGSNKLDQLLEAQNMKLDANTFLNLDLLTRFLARELLALKANSYQHITTVKRDMNGLNLPKPIQKALLLAA